MKKIIAFVLVLLMLPAVTFAEKTSCRGLVEFVELYTYRFATYAKKNDLQFDISIYSAIPPSKKGNYLLFETSAGTAGVYPGTYDIHDLTMTLHSLSSDYANNELYFTSCIMAISALEYDALYEVGPSFARKSAIEDASEIFDEKILGNIESAIKKAMETNEPAYVCSCNYNYYVKYIVANDRKYFYLIAEERK